MSTTTSAQPAQLTRNERLDRLPFNKAHRKLLVASGIGWAFDAMDVGLVSFVVAAIAADPHFNLTPTEKSWVLSIGFVGMAIGAAVGGLVGKDLFSMVEGLFDTPNTAGAVQAAVLMVITIGTLVYTVNKEKIATKRVSGALACAVIGLFLGIMSSFLGIGGGPINLVVLYYFFSMETKEAAQNSLYIILFSQAASTVRSILTMDLASISIALIAGMVACGILGGVAGRAMNKRIDSERVDKLFIGLMVVIILINVYNIAKYTVLA